MPRMGRIPALTRQGEAISGVPDKVCETCGNRFRAGRGHQRFCSSRCRLLSWAVTELEAAMDEGRAKGLRGRILRLGEKAEGAGKTP